MVLLSHLGLRAHGKRRRNDTKKTDTNRPYLGRPSSLRAEERDFISASRLADVLVPSISLEQYNLSLSIKETSFAAPVATFLFNSLFSFNLFVNLEAETVSISYLARQILQGATQCQK